MQLTLDMFETAALGMAVVFFGRFLRKKIRFLETVCIPAPVAGGLLFALLNLILYRTGILNIEFNETLKNFFMTMFFTTIGFQADFRSVKKGGKALVIFVVLIAVLIVLQNITSVGIAAMLGLPAATGMCTGSIPLVGGHGTSAAFGPTLESMGVTGATAYATAAATFGLVGGSLMGGPVAKRLIRKFELDKTADSTLESKEKTEGKEKNAFKDIAAAFFLLIVIMGIGSVMIRLLKLAGMNVPGYLGAMFVAAAVRNIAGFRKKELPMTEINEFSNISLNIFLGIAMITLKLWELADLAGPVILMLGAQVILMYLFVRFVIFNVMGKDYDAAVICAGTCGFGLGATPNALANMESVCGKYRYSEKAFLIVPLAGSIFVDFINAWLITTFLNFLK